MPEKNTTFTPGPWGMETVRTSCGVCHKIGPWPHKWRAGATMSACIYDDYPSPPEGTDTMLANARLIAAAPAMYEALRRAHGVLRDYITASGDIDDADLELLSTISAALSAASPRAEGGAE